MIFDSILTKAVKGTPDLKKGARVVSHRLTARDVGAAFLDLETCKALDSEGFFAVPKAQSSGKTKKRPRKASGRVRTGNRGKS